MSLRHRLPARVTVVEVGPRDGLQSEKTIVPTEAKIEFIERLAEAGLPVIEATSFVSPKAVPQLADADEVLRRVRRKPGVRYPVLVPNERGLERALAAGATEIAIFASASEPYSRKNLGRSRAEAIEMFRPVVARAKSAGLRVRGYLSMAIADPWEGALPIPAVVRAGLDLLELGADELSLGDTIGVGTPLQVQDLLQGYLDADVPAARLGVHFHDTYGQALANVLAALELGVSVVDASTGGLGGSTVIEGALGNLATEDLLWMLRGLGIETGVDLDAVVVTNRWLAGVIGRELPSRVGNAQARTVTERTVE